LRVLVADVTRCSAQALADRSLSGELELLAKVASGREARLSTIRDSDATSRPGHEMPELGGNGRGCVTSNLFNCVRYPVGVPGSALATGLSGPVPRGPCPRTRPVAIARRSWPYGRRARPSSSRDPCGCGRTRSACGADDERPPALTSRDARSCGRPPTDGSAPQISESALSSARRPWTPAAPLPRSSRLGSRRGGRRFQCAEYAGTRPIPDALATSRQLALAGATEDSAGCAPRTARGVPTPRSSVLELNPTARPSSSGPPPHAVGKRPTLVIATCRRARRSQAFFIARCGAPVGVGPCLERRSMSVPRPRGGS